MPHHYPPAISKLSWTASNYCEHCHVKGDMADEKQCPKCDKEVVCPHCDYCPECEELTYDMTIKCVVCEDEIPIDHGQFCSATCKREYENETDWED